MSMRFTDAHDLMKSTRTRSHLRQESRARGVKLHMHALTRHEVRNSKAWSQLETSDIRYTCVCILDICLKENDRNFKI